VVSYPKTTEPTDMLVDLWTLVSPWHHVLGRVKIPSKGAIFRRKDTPEDAG